LLSNNQKKCTDIKCFLCPDIDGAMKRVTRDGTENWAHVVCVNWTPEIWFKDDEKKEIQGFLNKDRFTINCSRCKKTEGSCMQCDYKACSSSMHARCAIKAGRIQNCMTMADKLGGEEAVKDFIPIFCKNHEGPGILAFKLRGI